MENTFSWNAEEYSKANSIQNSAGERLIRSAAFLPGMSVLDAGCGNGSLTFCLAGKVPQGRVTGIDSSASMIQKAKSAMRDQVVKNIEFRLCGINEIEYREQFDLVFSNSVLHWVSDIKDGLLKLFTALKRNGILKVQFPLLNKEHPLVRYAAGAIRELDLADHYDGWVFPWYVPESSEEFIRKLKDSGFTDIKVTPAADDFSFASANEVFQHFHSVGLDLYAAPLSITERKEFFDCVMHDLKRDFPDEVSLRYERIYAEARRP